MDWEATRAAVTDLESELICGICGDLMKDPFTLSVCHHHFCNGCIRPVLCGATFQCPQCAVPVWMQDLHPNRQLNTILRNLAVIREIVSSKPPVNSVKASEQVEAANQRSLSSPRVSPDGLTADSTLPTSSQTQVKPATLEASVLSSSSSGRRRNVRQARSCSVAPVRNCRQTPSLSETRFLNSDLSGAQLTISDDQSSLFVDERQPSGDLPSEGGVATSSRAFSHVSRTSTTPGGGVAASRTSRVSSACPVDVTVSVDLSHSALDEVGVRSKLREAAQVASHLHSAMSSRKVTSGDAMGHERGREISVEGELVSSRADLSPGDISLLGPSPPKRHQRDSVLDISISPLGWRKEKRNCLGETELHILAKKGRASELRTALQTSPDPSIKDHAGWTPLHEACVHGHVTAASVLLEHGALVNVPGHGNDTPLHDAVGNNHCSVAALLLKHGASCNIRNRSGLTALDLARTAEMKQILITPPHLHTTPPPDNSGRSPECPEQRLVLLASGLSSTQKALLTTLAKQLSAELVTRFSKRVTHVIVNDGVCVRTFKVLCGVATGKWILRFEWVSVCASAGVWVGEAPFEVAGLRVGNTVIRNACRKSRINTALKNPGLFDGCSFFLAGDFTLPAPSKEELSFLIQLSDGKVLSREPQTPTSENTAPTCENTAPTCENIAPSCPFHSSKEFPFNQFKVLGSSSVKCHSATNSTGTPTVVLRSDSDTTSTDTSIAVLPETSTLTTVAVVPATWILDSLSHFKLLNI